MKKSKKQKRYDFSAGFREYRNATKKQITGRLIRTNTYNNMTEEDIWKYEIGEGNVYKPNTRTEVQLKKTKKKGNI